MTLKRNGAEPIAIIGMAYRLPGGISTDAEYWDLLVNKRDARCKVPSSRYNIDAFSKSRLQSVASDYGYFLDTDISGIDTSFFGTKYAEADVMDPQLRLLFEVTWECLESAGQTAVVEGSDTGVFVGVFGEDWHNILYRDDLMPNTFRGVSSGDYSLSNGISYQYDLKGPSVTIKTACSSSLTGLHIACQSIRNGDCSQAIVLGSSMIMDPSMTLDMSTRGILSADGRCKTFDAGADGFARGEAMNALLIKPLCDALRDGDPIRAVIRATSVNSDGKTQHMATPSGEAQMAMIKRAYEAAGISDPSQTPFVECHGTGTMKGDPIEANIVGSVFGNQHHPTYIGSVKPNLGHGEGAAALTSIIKCVLALENKTIPPNINFVHPNPKISWEEHNLQVPVNPVPWPADRHERASISAFGFGGSNGHVILDSAASFIMKTSIHDTSTSTSETASLEDLGGESSETASTGILTPDCLLSDTFLRLLPVSASSEKALHERINSTQDYLAATPAAVDDVAYTLGVKTRHLSHRAFGIYDGFKMINFSPPTNSKGTKRIAFVFTGQGAQWPGMGRRLIEALPTFRDDIQEMDRVLQNIPSPPGWKLEHLLAQSDTSESSSFDHAEFAQPLCTAVQVALVNLLGCCGVTPSAIIGHSSGEIAAAYASGYLTMEEAIICAYFRGQVAATLKGKGSMAAIGLGPDQVVPFLVDGVQIACENSCRSVTISGDVDAVDLVIKTIEEQAGDTFVKKLQVDVAYHSSHMKLIGQTYEDLLKPFLCAQQSSRDATCPFYSSVTGQEMDAAADFGAYYWRNNLESPVLFSSAMKSLVKDFPNLIMIEIGPHHALRSAILQNVQTGDDDMLEKKRQDLLLTKSDARWQERSKSLLQGGKGPKQSPTIYISTLTRDVPSDQAILTTLGQLFVNSHPVNFGFVNPPGRLLTNLPRYPWDHKPNLWRESRLSTAWRLRKFPHHELLGARCGEASDLHATWRNMLHQYNVAWLKDHKLGEDIVFPAVGYIAMIGEAIRQRLGVECYVIENFIIKAALMIPENDYVEIMTTMTPFRLTSLSNSSHWYEFSIYVLTPHSQSWVEHCVAKGRVCTEEDDASSEKNKDSSSLKRQVSNNYIYERLDYIGFSYGPRFRGLADISADTVDAHAVATIKNELMLEAQESFYSVHPTALDCCLQLTAIAACRGIGRLVDTLAVPVAIGHIVVRPAGAKLFADAVVSCEENTSDIIALDAETNRLVVEMRNGRWLPFDNGGLNRRDIIHMARLKWLPDVSCHEQINFTRTDFPFRSVCKKLYRLAIASILQMLAELADLGIKTSECVPEHLVPYFGWLQLERNKILDTLCSLSSEIISEEHLAEIRQWDVLSQDERAQRLDDMVTDIGAMDNEPVLNIAKMMRRLCLGDNVAALFTDKIKPLQLCLESSGLESFYKFGVAPISPKDWLHLCAHQKPTLKVLEIGAGVGSMTEIVLPALLADDGMRMYSQYVFSDVSVGFFANAKDKFAAWEAIEYKTLDIEKSPTEQDFELASFDIVIASNVLHATRSLHESLLHIRSLLKPQGRLYLHELVGPTAWAPVVYITGLLPGWWCNRASDDREDGPTVSVERWHEELKKAGFSGVDFIKLDDDEASYSVSAHMASTVVGKETEAPNPLTFIYKTERTVFGCKLAETLEKQGHRITWAKLGESIEQDQDKQQDLVFVVELEGSFFDDIHETDYASFLQILTHHRKGLLWLTRSAQVLCTDPGYGATLGYLRAVRNELGLDCWTVEMDSLEESSSLNAAAKVALKFCGRNSLERNVDPEYAVRNGVVHIGRFYWFSTTKELQVLSGNGSKKQLVIGQYGTLEALHWVAQTEEEDLKSDEVEIDIRYVGVNFKDVLTTIGIIHGMKDSLGLECAGVIIRKGSDVTSLEIGDQVFTMGAGSYVTKKVLPAKHVHRILDGMTMEEAATMPVVYGTAVHAIINLGQLKKGQSILIHSAAGGVGQAAINICKVYGAEIYVTVGNEDKANFLMEEYQIPKERIFHSRNDSFVDCVMKSTNGRGVDLVLNSLAGDLLQASWKCVAKSGKMLEIGKRDMLEHGRLAMDMFENNRTFHGIDLSTMGEEDLVKLLQQVLEVLDRGGMKPIRPIASFTADRIADAFKYMKKGLHMGKIVVSLPEVKTSIPATLDSKVSLLSSMSTYLVVGGLGGLGREIARWMIERGARSLCFLSPSAASDKHKGVIEEFASQGCRITTIGGDVSKMEDVERAIAESPSPIGGVLQLSMVLRDRAILETKYSDWCEVLAPKIRGTWNLHNALLSSKLDFFILIGSQSGIFGQPGQANYASANSFLDSFSQYRQGLGLPCSVLDLSAVEGIGFLADKPSKIYQYKAAGMFLCMEDHLMEAIQISLHRSKVAQLKVEDGPLGGFTSMSQLTVGLASLRSASSPLNTTLFSGNVRFSMYTNFAEAMDEKELSPEQGLKELLAQIEADPSLLDREDAVDRASWQMGKTLFEYFDLPEEDLDIKVTLESIGVDSLVSIEIRNWWRRTLGLETTAMEIMNCGTIEGLGKMAVPALKKKYARTDDADAQNEFGEEVELELEVSAL